MKAREKLTENPGVTAAMKTVFWMAQEDIPLKKYSSLVDFLKIQGCQDLKKIEVSKNATYHSRSSAEEFQSSIAQVIEEDQLAVIKKSPCFSILIDESTDISVSKRMIVYIRVVNQDFVPQTLFLENICIDDVKSSADVLFKHLIQCLSEKGLDINKCLGFGSDGASVMTGRHNGVASKVKQKSPHCVAIHCMAHRLNLCSSQASKGIEYLKTFEKTCTDLYYYFGGSKSGNRKCELTEIQKVLDDPRINVKECHEIRWLSFSSAIDAISKTYSSLVTYFKSHGESSTTAKSVYDKLTDYRFVFCLHLLLDILPHVAQLSLLFQKQNIDIAAVRPAIDTLKKKIKLAESGSSSSQTDLKDKLVQTKDKSDSNKVKALKFKGFNLTFGKDLSKTSKELTEVRKKFCSNLRQNIVPLSRRNP